MFIYCVYIILSKILHFTYIICAHNVWRQCWNTWWKVRASPPASFRGPVPCELERWGWGDSFQNSIVNPRLIQTFSWDWMSLKVSLIFCLNLIIWYQRRRAAYGALEWSRRLVLPRCSVQPLDISNWGAEESQQNPGSLATTSHSTRRLPLNICCIYGGATRRCVWHSCPAPA